MENIYIKIIPDSNIMIRSTNERIDEMIENFTISM